MNVEKIVVGGRELVVEVASSWREITRGMMFRDWEFDGLLMDFGSSDRWMIHTFFCSGMDIHWLDEDFNIVDSVCAVPKRVYRPSMGARYVLETPEGLIKI